MAGTADGKSDESPVVIIGGGFSGICVAIDMIRRNKSRDFIILEKNAEVGGTWANNRYPGCRCDVSSHTYSLSFEPNPDWSHKFAAQPEILRYVTGIAEKWQLYPHFRFNTEVEECRWDEEGKVWRIRVRDLSKEGEWYEVRADFLVSAVGQLNIPHYPEIKGLDSFQGKLMHSARWDSTYSLEKKRIGIIGNGASAIQIVPELEGTCESMTVYQRTPNWIVPRNNTSYSGFTKALFRWIPGFRSGHRKLLVDMQELGYEAIVKPDTALNKFMRAECIGMMKDSLKNKPELIKKLTPDYTPGCKRIIPHDDFYKALDKPHVDLETTPIERVSSEGIVTVDGKEVKFDALILATGFRSVEFMHPIRVYGVNGRSIDDIWKGGARAYLGMTVECLPNFAMAYGPNTNLGHNSVILMLEAQSRYIATLIGGTLHGSDQKRVILPKPETVAGYNAKVQERMAATTFGLNQCRSWYKNADGLVTNNWYGTVVEYQKVTSKLEWDDYEVSGAGAKSLVGKNVWLGRVVEESILTRLGLFKPLAIILTLLQIINKNIWKIFGL